MTKEEVIKNLQGLVGGVWVQSEYWHGISWTEFSKNDVTLMRITIEILEEAISQINRISNKTETKD